MIIFIIINEYILIINNNYKLICIKVSKDSRGFLTYQWLKLYINKVLEGLVLWIKLIENYLNINLQMTLNLEVGLINLNVLELLMKKER
jgi:hypothetical protein